MPLATARIPGMKSTQGTGLFGSSISVFDAVVDSVDDIVDALIGLRPLRTVARPIAAIMPANIINNLTGLQKPSELIDSFEDSLEAKIKGLGGRGPRGPRLPRF